MIEVGKLDFENKFQSKKDQFSVTNTIQARDVFENIMFLIMHVILIPHMIIMIFRTTIDANRATNMYRHINHTCKKMRILGEMKYMNDCLN